MTKSTIRSNLSSFNPDIAATKAQGLNFILGETNSYSCHGTPGVSNTAGAALWALDYTLYASQIGVTRVHFHDGIGYKYNFVRHSPLLSVLYRLMWLNSDPTRHVDSLHLRWITSFRTARTPRSTSILCCNHSGWSHWKNWFGTCYWTVYRWSLHCWVCILWGRDPGSSNPDQLSGLFGEQCEWEQRDHSRQYPTR